RTLNRSVSLVLLIMRYENLQKWLTDETARDQFVIRCGSDTQVLWNDTRHSKSESVHKLQNWTGSFVQWSPLGTYLVTLLNPGVAVYGGATTFEPLMHYRHPMVTLVDVSPGENYLVTYHSQKPDNPQDASQVEIKIFDMRSGRVMRGFKGSADEFSAGGDSLSWPVALVQLPSKVEIRQKYLLNVSGCKMYWQSNGDYLAVKVDRYGSKSKKSTHSGFELFRIKEKDIPVEVLELDSKNDKIIDFSWEPNGHRFAVIHGDLPRPDVSFYSMKTVQHGGRVSKLVTLKAKQANVLFWSPTGKHVVLADGLSGFNGKLEFYNVDEFVTMATVDNFMATYIEWDPSGRYVGTAVTSSVHEMENGFSIWSFSGKLLYQTLKEQFSQATVIVVGRKGRRGGQESEEVQRQVREDDDVSMSLSKQGKEKRRMMREEWEMWLNKWKMFDEEDQTQRENHLIGDDEEKEEYSYETMEELINVSEEVVPYEQEQNV
ncbi:unnamed protein product, partial [Thlaspi arvense]